MKQLINDLKISLNDANIDGFKEIMVFSVLYLTIGSAVLALVFDMMFAISGIICSLKNMVII